VVSSGQGTQNVTISPIGSSSGTATIGVNISVGGCASFPIGSKEVWVGKPQLDFIIGPMHAENAMVGENYQAFPIIPQACASYNWAVSPYYYSLSPGNGNATISFPYDGDFIITCNAQNTCGISDDALFGVAVGIYEPYIIYPNPSTESATISINETDNQTAIAGTAASNRLDISPKASYIISVYNSMGFEVFHKQKKGRKINIITSQLKEGTYIVSVSDGKNCFKKQLVVKH